MAFVMQQDFTLDSKPKLNDSLVRVRELKNYKVAAIQFSGTLSDSNVQKYSQVLSDWLASNGYTSIGEPVKAGYNGPLTLPMFRKNEVLISIK